MRSIYKMRVGTKYTDLLTTRFARKVTICQIAVKFEGNHFFMWALLPF